MIDQHKADEACDRVVELLTGLDTTGERVVAERAYLVDSEQLPALSVFMGDEELIDDNVARATQLLEILVAIHVDEHEATAGVYTSENTRRTILKIAREIAVAIGADCTLGKNYITRAWISARSRPAIDREAARPHATSELTVRVMYTHDYNDPGKFT